MPRGDGPRTPERDEREQTSSDAVSPAYFKAFRADVLSMTGDWFTYVAMSQLAASHTHARASLLIVAASHTLPRWLLTPWAGALSDRLDRRRILVAVQCVRALLLAAMAMAATRISATNLLTIHALHVARMGLGAFADTALRSAIPSLVPASKLRWAHARSGLAWSTLLCIATALGGVTVAATGASVAFAVDALSYALSAALFAALPALPAAHTQSTQQANWRQFRESLSADRPFAQALFAKVPAALVQGAVFVLVAQRAQAFAARAAIALAAMHVARGIGAGAGPYVLSPRRALDPGLAASALALAAASLFVLARPAPVAPSLALLVALGLGTGASWVHSSAAVAARAPASLRGRTAATELAVQAIFQWLGSAIAVSSLGAWAAIALAGLAWTALSLHDRGAAR